MAGLWDLKEFNSGFVIVRPSAVSQQLYRTRRQLTATTSNKEMLDQEALNRAVKMMKSHSEHGRVLRTKALNERQFMCGRKYFGNFGRLFDLDRPSNRPKLDRPIVAHNNYIITKEAKIYRFREHLMWLYDGDDQYYSNETRTYVTYTNVKPTVSSSNTPENVVERELAALKTALAIGHLLNRVVILPRFHRGNAGLQCFLYAHLHIKTFDSMFSGRYRESSFLRHPKVPDSVKQGVTDIRFHPHDNQTSDVLLSGTDVMRLLSKQTAKVLNLNDLRRVKIDVNDGSFDHEFSSKLQAPFRRSDYGQSY